MNRETKIAVGTAAIFLLLAGGAWTYKKYVLGEENPTGAQNETSSAAAPDVGRATLAASLPTQPPPPQAPEVPAATSNGPSEADVPVAEAIAFVFQKTQEHSALAAGVASDALDFLLSNRSNVQAGVKQTSPPALPPQQSAAASPPTLTAPPAPEAVAMAAPDTAKSEAPPKAAASPPQPAAVAPSVAINDSAKERSAAALSPPVRSATTSDRGGDTSSVKPPMPDAPASGGIPVTIRPQPDLPAAPPPAATQVPRTNDAGVRPAAQVQDYEVTLYDIQQGDTYASISQANYGSDSYQTALAAFNRDLDPQAATLAKGQRVRIPPAWVLEGRYRNLIPGLAQVTSPPSTSKPVALHAKVEGDTSDSVRQPARLLPNLGPEQTATGLGSPAPRVNAALPPSMTAKEAAQANWTKDTKPYKVRPNDTIWSIAKQTLGKGERWPEISRLNRDVLPDVNQLRAGMTLRLPNDAKLDTAETPQ